MKKIKQLVFLPIFALGIFSCNTSQTEIPFQKNEPVDFSKVKIKDSFCCLFLKTFRAFFFENIHSFIQIVKAKDFQAFVESQKGKRKIKILNVDEENLQALISTNDKYINEVVDDLSGYKIKGFSGKNETLEDYFMKFYKEEKDFGGAL